MKIIFQKMMGILQTMLYGRRADSSSSQWQSEESEEAFFRGQTHSMRSRPRLAKRADPVEVAATLPVLDSLSKHLRETAADLQESVLQISTGFGGMAARARETVQIAQGGLHNDGGVNTDQTIMEIRYVLQSLLTAVQDSSHVSQRMSARISDLEKVLKGVNHSLVRVEGIAEEARIVGLNGRLEAARAGTYGSAFNVVANETKNLATNATETSTSIRKLVKELDASLRSVSKELQERITQDADVARRSQITVSQLLDQLSVMHHGMTESLQRTESISESLTQEIGRSVMALQFQDRVNQRLDHVCETLLALHENLQPFAGQVPRAQAEMRAADWREWLASRSTMKSERALISSPDGSAESGGNSDFGSVELF